MTGVAAHVDAALPLLSLPLPALSLPLAEESLPEFCEPLLLLLPELEFPLFPLLLPPLEAPEFPELPLLPLLLAFDDPEFPELSLLLLGVVEAVPEFPELLEPLDVLRVGVSAFGEPDPLEPLSDFVDASCESSPVLSGELAHAVRHTIAMNATREEPLAMMPSDS